MASTQDFTLQAARGEKDTLFFPLERQLDYKGKIVFTVRQVAELSEQDLERMKKIAGANINSSNEEEANAANSLATGSAGATLENKPAERTPGRSAVLYMPMAITINDGVNYENIDLGTIGATVEAGIGSGESIIGAAASGFAEGIQSFMDAFGIGTGGGGDLARLAVTRAANAFAPAGVAGAVTSRTRTTINPNARSLFRSVKVREFPFTFRMIATSSDEAKQIKEIIKFFRTQLYPESIGAQGNSFSIGYKLPDPFSIKIYYGEEQVVGKILESYLTDVSVSYNSNGAAMHKDGNFTEVSMSLTFVETRALTREDIVNDNGRDF